jgi:fatty acid desaturase
VREPQENSVQRNPETAFHADRLHQERRKARRSAAIMFACCIIVLGAAAVVLAISLFFHTPLALSMILLLGCMVLAGAAGVVSGMMDLHASKQPVTSQEIEQNRQQARTELMQRAQGKIPLAYRRFAIISEIVLACFWALLSIPFFLMPVTHMRWVYILFGVLFLLCAVRLLGDALIVRPRQAKRLAAQSARELAQRLTLEEVMQGHLSEEA